PRRRTDAVAGQSGRGPAGGRLPWPRGLPRAAPGLHRRRAHPPGTGPDRGGPRHRRPALTGPAGSGPWALLGFHGPPGAGSAGSPAGGVPQVNKPSGVVGGVDAPPGARGAGAWGGAGAPRRDRAGQPTTVQAIVAWQPEAIAQPMGTFAHIPDPRAVADA